MKVFLSWSKPRSRQVAEALRDWLPLVLQRIEPWMSAADLEAGVRWGQLLSEQLDSTAFGIICVTEENKREPWLHFEAGAISKKVASSRVIPLGFGIDKSAMPGPLQQFQAVNADEAGIRSIVRSLHASLTDKLPDERLLTRTVEKWLPEFFGELAKIKPLEEQPKEPEFSQSDATREMLLMLRQISREVCDRTNPNAPVIFRVRLTDIPPPPLEHLKTTLRPLGLQHFEQLSPTRINLAIDGISTEVEMANFLEHLRFSCMVRTR